MLWIYPLLYTQGSFLVGWQTTSAARNLIWVSRIQGSIYLWHYHSRLKYLFLFFFFPQHCLGATSVALLTVLFEELSGNAVNQTRVNYMQSKCLFSTVLSLYPKSKHLNPSLAPKHTYFSFPFRVVIQIERSFLCIVFSHNPTLLSLVLLQSIFFIVELSYLVSFFSL